MPKQPNLEKITSLAEAVVEKLGLVLVDVRFGQAGSRHTLEVTVHRLSGNVSLEDCEAVSRSLEKALDEQVEAALAGSFLLEVQSPGIDRKLTSQRELAIFTGQPVTIEAKEKIGELGFTFRGTLLGSKEGVVSIGDPAIEPAQSKRSSCKSRCKTAQTTAALPPTVDIVLTQIASIRLQSAELVIENKDLATRKKTKNTYNLISLEDRP